MQPEERKHLLDRACQGYADALWSLLESFRPYARVVVSAVPGLPKARVDHSDAVQDAFVEVQKQFANFQGDTIAEFVVWLRTILLGTVAKLIRQHHAKGRCPERERSAEEILDELTASTSSPAAKAEKKELADRVFEALARLPDEMQKVLLARYFDDLPHAEIAKRLGKSEGAVRQLYCRALGRLRELFPGAL